MTESTNGLGEQAPASVNGPSPPRGRYWLAVALIVAYWAVAEALVHLELTDFRRFITRLAAQLVLLIFFSIWWLRRQEIARRDRWLAVVAVLAVFALACAVADASINPFGMFLSGWPWLCTLGVVWLWLSRASNGRRRAVGVVGTALLVFGTLACLRWDGLDGRQRSSFSWRWSPTAEDAFLAERGNASNSPDVAALQRDVVLRPGDWPAFRGGDLQGVVSGADVSAWTTHPPQMVWRRKVGPAWSSVAVVDGLLFTQEQRGPEECTVCYDAATGDERWVQQHAARFDEPLSGPGPRATPTFADGRIYTYGAKGDLACLAADTGAVVWSKSVLKDVSAEQPMWGLSVSPLVTDGLVVVFAGGPNERGLLAYDAADGADRWCAAAGTQTYASPQVLTLAGVRQVVLHDNTALRGFAVDTGRLLWEHPNPGDAFQPMLQPHAVGESELVVAWDPGIVRLKLTPAAERWSVETVWASNRLKPSFNDFFVQGDHIYGLDDGILCCVKLADGQRVWKKGRYGSGQLLLLPEANQLLVVSERGEAVVVAVDPQQHRELALHAAITGKTWNHAAFAHGRLYVRNAEELACLECGPPTAPAASRVE